MSALLRDVLGLELEEAAACGAPETKAAHGSALQPCAKPSMGFPSLPLPGTEARAGVRGTRSPRGSWDRAAGALSADAPRELGLYFHSDALPWPSWPPCSPLVPPLTSPCASSTVFMNTAIPIAAVLIVSEPFSSAQGWGQDRWRDIRVPPSCRRISKAVSRCEGECRCPPSSLHTDGALSQVLGG